MPEAHETVPNIESYSFDVTTQTTPNSKLPILVYRNVLDKHLVTGATKNKEYIDHMNRVFMKNGWEALGVFPCITRAHYHPNVHEAYAVISGQSDLILGLDVNYNPSSMTHEDLKKLSYLELSIKDGDIIVIPAGVSHCSKRYDKEYRYVGLYPMNGERWKSVSSTQVKEANGHYDNSKDVMVAQNVPLPIADPIYNKGGTGTLLELWGASS